MWMPIDSSQTLPTSLLLDRDTRSTVLAQGLGDALIESLLTF